jgi:hypothetical protein
MLDAHLRQSIIIWLARSAWLCRCPGSTLWRLRRQDENLISFVELEQMPLSGGFHQPFPAGTEDIAAVEIELSTQLIDRLLVFLDGLVVQLGRLIERGAEVLSCGLEVLDLLGEPV